MSLLKSLFIIIALISQSVWAGKEFNVFDVRKNIPLTDNEPIYHDYYINMGIEDGAKVGARLLVYRKIPVLDIYRNKAQADLVSPVAQMMIIHAQNSLSIARIRKMADPKRTPLLQQGAVMVGDRVELIGESETKNEKDFEEKPAETNSEEDKTAQAN